MRLLKLRYCIYVASLFCLFTACVKDIPNPDKQSIPDTSHQGVFMLHEGAYGNNNSEISFLDFTTLQLSESIYHTINGGTLGDVAQSAYRYKQHLFIALTNSNTVVELDAQTFKELARYPNVTSPRYMMVINDSILYVSSLYQNKLFILNTITKTVVSNIIIDHANSEQMVLQNDKLWLSSWHTQCNYIYKINTITHTIDKRVNIPGYAPHGMVEDKNGNLWILSGNQYKSVVSHLTCIRPTDDAVLHDYTFPSQAEPIKLSTNLTKDTLFFIGVNYSGKSEYNGLFKMGITENSLPSLPFIQAKTNSYFWGFGIDPTTNEIYIADPKGFTQHSTIYVHAANGQFSRQFEGGIGTNSFIFY